MLVVQSVQTVRFFSCFASPYIAIIIEVDSLNCYCELLRDTTVGNRIVHQRCKTRNVEWMTCKQLGA